MAIANQELTVQRGDSKTYILNFKDDSGNVIDITGWTIYFTVKENASQPDSEAIIQKNVTSHSDPTNGETQIELSSSDTDHVATYIYDIQYKDDSGNIKTVVQGGITFQRDITRRTD